MRRMRNAECGVRNERWITIGVVRVNWYVRWMQWGVPGGLLMHWRGRTHLFQQFEFLKWHNLLASARRRLSMAKLEPVSFACAVPREGDNVTLRVLVRRNLTTDEHG